MLPTRIYNAAAEFVDRNVDGGSGDRTAFVDPDRSLTYRELCGESCRMANLLASHGLNRESRIAMLMLDTVDFPVVFWGALRAGVVPVALNTLLTAEQYRYILDDCRAQALFVSAPLLPALTGVLDEVDWLEYVFVVGEQPASDSAVGKDLGTSLKTEAATAATAETCADETAFWLYSSGSTGMPKGVLHVHSSLMETARHYGQGVLGLEASDVVFSAAKLFFAYGLGNAMSIPMSVGATTILWPQRPTPEAVFAQLKAHDVTVFYGVPTLYAAMLADPACTPERGSRRLRRCVSAGEALPAEVGKSWQSRFGVEIIDGVGSTEMLHIFLSNRPGAVAYGKSGTAVPGYDLRLVDEAGAEVAEGEIGELLVRGESAASAYWNQRAKSRATFEGAWTRTGDRYTHDADGIYEYCGRTDDMFKVSGIWVSPFEVESALISHDAVLEAAVVPAEDGDGLTKPKAFVVLKSGVASDGLFDDLKDHVKAAVGAWKYPRWIDFVDDLPKTATGKIQRFKLREGET